jgi:signal transduction histidine kinase
LLSLGPGLASGWCWTEKIGAFLYFTPSTLLKKADPKLKPIVTEIKKSIWRVERIIKATLLFSKGVKLKKTTFSSVKLKEELSEVLGYYSYQKEIDFRFDFEEVDVKGDFELLMIVFQNFLFNSIDAIEEDDENDEGAIKINLTKVGNKIKFTIKDSGKDFENKNILYEPFKTTKTKGHGLGGVGLRRLGHFCILHLQLCYQKGLHKRNWLFVLVLLEHCSCGFVRLFLLFGHLDF